MKKYNAKALIGGFKLGPMFRNMTLIAVPDKFKGEELQVEFDGKSMVIPCVGSASQTFRSFTDKFGRKDAEGNPASYTLYYYEWEPNEN